MIGCDIENVDAQPSKTLYPRDHLIILSYPKIIICINNEQNKTLVKQIAEKIPKGFKLFPLNADLEGGNVVHFTKDDITTLYIGNYPHVELPHRDAIDAYLEIVERKQTIRRLDNIEVELLTVNCEVPQGYSQTDYIKLIEEHYFHLDCFITIIPDLGKIIILNKQLIDHTSFEMLADDFGENNVIDLNHDFLTNPFSLNMVAIPLTTNEYLLFASTLPDQVAHDLETHGFRVVYNQTFNPNHRAFNAELTEQVTQELQLLGWGADKEHLIDGIPNFNGIYQADNIIKLIAADKVSINATMAFLKHSLGDFKTISPQERTFLLHGGELIIKAPQFKEKNISVEEKIRLFLQVINKRYQEISFELIRNLNDTYEIKFTVASLQQKINLIAAWGGVHCFTQELPVADGNRLSNYQSLPKVPSFFRQKTNLSTSKPVEINQHKLF